MAARRMSADERRQQIMEIGRQCFAENGFDSTTTAMIAADAAVTEPVLYRHFDSKRELFHAILEETLEESLEHFEEVSERGANGAEKLLAVVEDFPRYSQDKADVFRVIDRALATANDPVVRQYLCDYYTGFDKALRDIIALGIEDRSVKPEVDADALSWMLVMTGVGYSLVTAIDLQDVRGPDFSHQLADLVEAIIEA